MTTNYHTPHTDGPTQLANAAQFNGPLGQLDAAIKARADEIVALQAALGNVQTINATTGNFAGTVTAAAFLGDGSGLTGIGTGTGGVINTGSTTIGADSDANGVGEIALQTAGVTKLRIENDGTIHLGEVVPKRVHAVYALGDSLTQSGSYPAKIATLLGSHWVVRNRGVGGQTTEQMASRLQADVLDAGDCEYLIVFGGINDVVGDVAAATIETNLQTIYTAAAAAGLVVIAVTITPFKTNAYWSAGRQAVLDAVNAWIAGSATDVDYVYDAYAAMEDPGAADTLRAAYDSGDHLHLSATGSDLVGTGIHTAVTWTPATADAVLTLSGPTLGMNQSLRSTDDVTFGDITATGALAGDAWKAHTVDAQMQIQNSAGSELVRVATAIDTLYGFVDAYLTGKAGYAILGLYANNDTAYFPNFLNFRRSRGTFTAPSVISPDDSLGTLNFAGYATGYQSAATLQVVAAAVGAASVDGRMILNLSRSGSEKEAARFSAGTGVVFNEGGDSELDFRIESDADQFAFYVDAGANSVAIGGASTSKVGFYGVTPTVRQVLATGAGATVDNVITALQALGLVKQS